MVAKIKHDYNEDLDILHIYSEEIKQGVRGCLSTDYITLDISKDNKFVGAEIEEASKILNTNPLILKNPDRVSLNVRREGNMLLVGISLSKKQTNISFQFSVNSPRAQFVSH